jgi:hypothetical protein
MRVFCAGSKRPKISEKQNRAVVFFHRIAFIVACATLGTSLSSANARTVGAFSFANVSELAKKAADEGFRAPPSIPDFLKTISYDDYRDIRFDVKQTLWRERGNFQVQFIHPGFVYGNAVRLNTIEEGAVKRINFNPNLFTYGGTNLPKKFPPISASPDFVSRTRSIKKKNSITSQYSREPVISERWQRARSSEFRGGDWRSIRHCRVERNFHCSRNSGWNALPSQLAR